MPFDLHSIRALVFDVQGTAVDFYTPMQRMGAEVNAEKGIAIDWERLSADWRALYREAMDAVVAGRRPWLPADRIYREILDLLLDGLRVGDRFSALERDAISGVWTRLEPWPDSVAGLARLRRKFVTATLSNAGMPALIAVLRHADLRFDCILSADLARSFKPAPALYQLAVDSLGLAPSACLMVASHKYDLAAARSFGMHTAFVTRPLEFGPTGRTDTTFDPTFDINARDFHDLADQLGA